MSQHCIFVILCLSNISLHVLYETQVLQNFQLFSVSQQVMQVYFKTEPKTQEVVSVHLEHYMYHNIFIFLNYFVTLDLNSITCIFYYSIIRLTTSYIYHYMHLNLIKIIFVFTLNFSSIYSLQKFKIFYFENIDYIHFFRNINT